jgi:hypothetical protein
MKLTLSQTIKILFYCVLVSETIICSSSSSTVSNSASAEATAEASAEGKFLMQAGFLKKKKTATQNNHKTAPKAIPATRLAPKPRQTEAISLMQKSETVKSAIKAQSKVQSKSALKQDMNALDKLAIKLGNQPTNPLDPKPLDLEIGDGPVWVTGWVKYFKYYPSMATLKLQPKDIPQPNRQFVTNPQYNEQFKTNPNFDKNQKSKDDLDNDLDVYITQSNRFYAKLARDQLLILSGREVKIKI